MRAASSKEANAIAVTKRRNAEAGDRMHFLVYGHDEHVDKCLFRTEGGEACSRTYNPMPSPDARPYPEVNYVGTSIGALYGIPGGSGFLWELAGWNVVLPGDNEERAHWEYEEPVGLMLDLEDEDGGLD